MSEEFLKRQALAAFDAHWYANRYADVSGSGLSPRQHFELFGFDLQRAPNELWETDRYNTSTQSLTIIEGDHVDSPSSEAHREDITLSIICLTYNHQDYIEEAIQSFLEQDVNFKLEIIIADDSSSDGTRELIKKHADADRRIKPIYRKQNIGPQNNFLDAASQARGKYVALCEGDDYWIDSSKLQRQVDFLESHPDYTICFHPVRIVEQGSTDPGRVFPADMVSDPPLTELVKRNFIQTNSVVYRWRFRNGFPSWYEPNVTPGDWHLHLLHAEIGRIKFLPYIMAVYRRHPKGMWSTSSVETQLEHRRRHGNGELSFFRTLRDRFGGYYAEYFEDIQVKIFIEIAEDCLLHENYKRLYDIIESNREISLYSLKKMGLNVEKHASCEDDLKSLLKDSCKISVIVLSYNQSDYIEQCMQSILSQTGYFTLEIIVRDDGSTDGTKEVINRVAADCSIIDFDDAKVNVGMLKSLQACLSKASGDYVAFCEGDDYWIDKKKLLKQARCLDRNKKAGMCFNWILLDIADTCSLVPHPEQANLGHTVSFEHLSADPVTANFSCCFYRRSAISAVPKDYFEVSWAADWLFNLYIADKHEVLFNRQTMSVYRVHSRGQWSRLTAQERQRKISIANEYMERVFKRVPVAPTRPVVVVDATEESALNDFSLNLDYISENVIDSKLFIRGWALHLLGCETRLVVRRSNAIEYYSLTERRDDVINYYWRIGERFYRDSRIGFDIELFVGTQIEDVDLGLIMGGNMYWWKRISIAK